MNDVEIYAKQADLWHDCALKIADSPSVPRAALEQIEEIKADCNDAYTMGRLAGWLDFWAER